MINGAGTSTEIHLKPDKGSPLSAKEQKELLYLLTEGPGPKSIPLRKARLLAEMIGGALASYNPGTDDIAFLSAATDLVPHLEVAQDPIAIPASS